MKDSYKRIQVCAHIEFRDHSGKTLWQKYRYESNRSESDKTKRHLEILSLASPYIRANYMEIYYTVSKPE